MQASEGGTSSTGNRLDLREPMASIREDLAHLGSDVATAGRRVVQSGAQALSDSAQAVGARARDAQRALFDFATERPGQCMLLTLGAGILIGALFLRRR